MAAPRRSAVLGAGLALVVAASVGVATLQGGAAQVAVAAVLDPADRITVAGTSTGSASRSAIDPSLERKLAEKLTTATADRVGIVVDVAGVGRVATINPAGAMRPASTQKLFTTLPLLLEQPDRRLHTTVTATAKPHDGVLRGDLVVHAAVDPSLLRRHLSAMTRQIRAAGIRKVTGRLVLDIGDYSLRTRREGWKPSFVPDDIGPLSPFPVYENVWRKDPGFVDHPTLANLRLFRDFLHAGGVRVVDGVRVTRDAPGGAVVADHGSAPMTRLVRHTLRVSDNFYAESLLVHAGGLARVRELVDAAGITDLSVTTDGSGLSYDDRQSPRGEVQLLRYARTGPAYDLLRAALPVACRTGTLEHRFCGTIAEGMVWAKTGTLTHTTALAGWTVDALGRQVTFSVITAGVRDWSKAVRATDRAILVLRRYAG
jgi:serine-type D-Ala-D-Ala carboxypeptidase/endopeptidase (penicillin-binding protein 4)